MINKLVVATHNSGKAKEIADLLRDYVPEFVTAGDLNLPEPEETADSFKGNALLKARAAAEGSGLPALADDSGLAVEALGGDPGVFSARWGGPDRDFNLAMETVYTKLADNPNRRASFICALAVVWPDGREVVVEGKVTGDIVWPPRGGKGFGYDPVFQPLNHDITFAEMEPDAKHKISHRADAFAKLVQAVFKQAA